MASSNKNLHITLDERKIIETGIHNGSTKPLSPRPLAKTNPPSAGRSISIAIALTSALFLLNATITSTAGWDVIAGLPALVLSPSPVTEGITPLAPAMAAPRSVPATSTISAMMLPLPTPNTGRPFPPRAKASTSPNLISSRSVLSSGR